MCLWDLGPNVQENMHKKCDNELKFEDVDGWRCKGTE